MLNVPFVNRNDSDNDGTPMQDRHAHGDDDGSKTNNKVIFAATSMTKNEKNTSTEGDPPSKRAKVVANVVVAIAFIVYFVFVILKAVDASNNPGWRFNSTIAVNGIPAPKIAFCPQPPMGRFVFSPVNNTEQCCYLRGGINLQPDSVKRCKSLPMCVGEDPQLSPLADSNINVPVRLGGFQLKCLVLQGGTKLFPQSHEGLSTLMFEAYVVPGASPDRSYLAFFNPAYIGQVSGKGADSVYTTKYFSQVDGWSQCQIRYTLATYKYLNGMTEDIYSFTVTTAALNSYEWAPGPRDGVDVNNKKTTPAVFLVSPEKMTIEVYEQYNTFGAVEVIGALTGVLSSLIAVRAFLQGPGKYNPFGFLDAHLFPRIFKSQQQNGGG
eukprot:PhF_6_TR22593/c1_g1_i3/m.32239